MGQQTVESLGFHPVFDQPLRFAFWQHAERRAEKFVEPTEIGRIVGSDPDGGYLVTPSMSNKIIAKLYESDPIRQLAAVETSTSGSREWIVDADDAGAEWETETVASSDTTTPNVRKKRITAHALGTRPLASQELLEDSPRSIEKQ